MIQLQILGRLVGGYRYIKENILCNGCLFGRIRKEKEEMKCRCGRKARCVAKEPEYYDDREIGVWRRYECKHCGFTFDTVEHLEDKEGNKNED